MTAQGLPLKHPDAHANIKLCTRLASWLGGFFNAFLPETRHRSPRHVTDRRKACVDAEAVM